MSQTIPAGQLLELKLTQLKPATDNPRRDVGDVTELAESIKALGILEPIVAVADNGHYKIVAGARRFAAAKLAGLDSVQVMVHEFSESDRVAAMLIENLQRSDLTALEEAGALDRLIREFELSQRDVGEKVGRSQAHISKRLALLELPAAVRKELDSGGITLGDAYELTKLTGMPKRLGEAFKRRNGYGGIPGAVKSELDQHKLIEKIGKATQGLKEKGLKVVQFTQRGAYYSPELPKGMSTLSAWSYREAFGRGKPLSVEAHSELSCHAAAVDSLGDVVYVCTNVASHKTRGPEIPADAKEAARKQREKEKANSLRAREANIALGAALAARLNSPAIDVRNMRLIADLLLMEIGSELGQCSFRYVDEASQTIITKKDGSTSRIVHLEGSYAGKLIDDRLKAAQTPEEIMGVLLQALVAARYVDRNAVPASQRMGYLRALGNYPTSKSSEKTAIEQIAAAAGVVAKRPKAAA